MSPICNSCKINIKKRIMKNNLDKSIIHMTVYKPLRAYTVSKYKASIDVYKYFQKHLKLTKYSLCNALYVDN